MKKLIITSIVATTIFSSCTKSIEANKKEEGQTVYFRLSYESKSEKVTANNIITAKFK